MAASPLASIHAVPSNEAMTHELLGHRVQSHAYNRSIGGSTSLNASLPLQQQEHHPQQSLTNGTTTPRTTNIHPSTASTSGSSHYYHSPPQYSHTSSPAYASSSITNTHTAASSSKESHAPTTASSTGTSIIPLIQTHLHAPLSPSSYSTHPSSNDKSPAASSTSASFPSPGIVAVQNQSHHQSQEQRQASRTSTFIREGDVVYENCPPPPTLNPVLVNRSYTILKEVGDGSFGTVWLADWHSPLALPKGTGPPGPSSRPEYKGKRLVALKRMKKAFEGGWDECMKLKELKSLRSISAHPNIIPLYDAFLLPSTKELYFVFECMEGNLYQLTKSRKGRPLAAGLVASLLKQMLAGLHHIHESGYFHRDMKPENLLITTTGLADYPAYIPPSSHNTSSSAQSTSGGTSIINRPPEKDVVAIVKIADFGLARETLSKPPYTEYVSTRWYRAPEVILRSRDYSHPVDMWALGTILSEMVNLKPLFPGQSEVDQVFRICEVLGDPTTNYGRDEVGRIRGGGYWDRSIKMAKSVGFSFPKIQPINFYSLYDKNLVPIQLIDIMADLMRYDPKFRLTTSQCLEHPYFRQVTPLLEATPITAVPNHIRQQQQAQVQQQQIQQQQLQQQQQQKVYSLPTPSSAHSQGFPAPNSASFPSPRNVPSSHTQASQFSKQGFEQRHHYISGMSQPAPGSAASYQSASQHSQTYQHSLQHSQQQQQRDRQVSGTQSLVPNDGVGFGGMQVVHGGPASPHAVGYPESVVDVSMDGADETISPTSAIANGGQQYLQQTGRSSPAPSSVHSFGREGAASLPLPLISHQQASPQLPLPHTHHYAPSYQQQLRQGVNGYPSSTHSGSFYNPSVYSGISAHSGGSGGRRGSAGGASTFYDGSIFEGIAPTRAASILSLPVTYGEAPPSPNFALPSNYPSSVHSHQQTPSYLGAAGAAGRQPSLRRARTDADNVSVDFEREALQRSQNTQPPSISLHGVAVAGVPKSDSQDSLKTSNTKGKKSWMSSLLGSNNDSSTSSSSAASVHKQPQYHPQQQPLIHPSGYAPSASSSASVSHFSIAGTSGSSLKRTPSERSIHALEQPPTQPQQPTMPLDPKKAKKEAERLAKEAEKAKREAATKAARERARAVMQKRNALAQAADPLHSYGHPQSVPAPSSNKTLSDKEKKAILEQRKQQSMMNGQPLPQIAEDPRSRLMVNQYSTLQQSAPDVRYKARRRGVDDDVHSMSSNETRSERRFSISSQNTMSTVSTMDSDPGPPRPGRQGGFLAPLRRSPSASSFSGQSHLSVGSTGSGHAPASGRRDLGTSGSGTSSLEYGLVGRFKGLSAADAASSSTSPASASSHSHSEAPLYYRHSHSPSQMLSQGHPNHQQHNISLPPIQSFDRPPPKEFSFSDSTHPQNGTPQTSHSNHSNNSTISANSRQYHGSSGQLPFTPEMYHHHQMQQSQQ